MRSSRVILGVLDAVTVPSFAVHPESDDASQNHRPFQLLSQPLLEETLVAAKSPRPIFPCPQIQNQQGHCVGNRPDKEL
jgi:hypothetical protein